MRLLTTTATRERQVRLIEKENNHQLTPLKPHLPNRGKDYAKVNPRGEI
jgi:hypothetical protein